MLDVEYLFLKTIENNCFMKKILFILGALIIACNSSQKTTETIQPTEETQISPIGYAATVTEDELKEHLYIYASDEFEGRETGTQGQKKAVEYIVGQYKKMGISAAKEDGDYLQKVPLEITKAPTGTISLNGSTYQMGNDFVTFSTIDTSVDELVYLNYGIQTNQYSDYKGIDVKDKVVLVRTGEPKNTDGTYVLTGSTEPSKWSSFDESLEDKLKIANEKGAKAILVLDKNTYPRLKGRYKYIARSNNNLMTLTENLIDELPPVFAGGKLAKELINITENVKTSKVVNVDLQLSIKSANTKIDSENVIAYIPGKELPEEYVIISSHLDHIGVNEDGQINNGADDDGSGTVALIEIAQAFKKAADDDNGPKRSIVFLHVTGEEKGLLGSRYYTDFEPIFPLENTVANLNIDMIGRIDPQRNGDRNYIYLIGSDKLSQELHELSEDVNDKYTKIELDYKYNDENDPNRFYYRSDHYNFAKNNIPIIFYFNGTHADYHRPGDTPDKINYDLLKNRTQLIFYTAWEVANRENKIIVDKAIR